MKDYIKVTDKNNKTRTVEVIATFKLEGYDYTYIIYKELDGSHDYVARYNGDNNVILDTNLTPMEFKMATIIYGGIKS